MNVSLEYIGRYWCFVPLPPLDPKGPCRRMGGLINPDLFVITGGGSVDSHVAASLIVLTDVTMRQYTIGVGHPIGALFPAIVSDAHVCLTPREEWK